MQFLNFINLFIIQTHLSNLFFFFVQFSSLFAWLPNMLIPITIFIVCYLILSHNIQSKLVLQIRRMKSAIKHLCGKIPSVFLPLTIMNVNLDNYRKSARSLLPIKACLICLTLVAAYLVMKILSIIFWVRNFNRPLPPLFLKYAHYNIKIASKIILFFAGFYSFKIVKHHIKDLLPNYPTNQSTLYQKPPIILANHSNPFDFLVLNVLGNNLKSFIQRSELKKVPILNYLIEATQSIYWDKENKNSKKEVFEEIQSRAKSFRTSQNQYPQIAIFPEEVTTDNRHIIKFEPVAFEKPVSYKIYAIIYEGHWKPTSNLFGDVLCGIILIGTFLNRIIVHELVEEYNPQYLIESMIKEKKSDKEIVNELSETVRLLMGKMSKLTLTSHTLEDKVKAEQKYQDFLKEMYEKYSKHKPSTPPSTQTTQSTQSAQSAQTTQSTKPMKPLQQFLQQQQVRINLNLVSCKLIDYLMC